MNKAEAELTVSRRPYCVAVDTEGRHGEITEVLPQPESVAGWRNRPRVERGSLHWHPDSRVWMLGWQDINRASRTAMVDTLTEAALRFDDWLLEYRNPAEYEAGQQRLLQQQVEALDGAAL